MINRCRTVKVLAVCFVIPVLTMAVFAANESVSKAVPNSGAVIAAIYEVRDPVFEGKLSEKGGTVPVLKDVHIVEQGGQMLIAEIWDTPPGYSSELLLEYDFEKNREGSGFGDVETRNISADAPSGEISKEVAAGLDRMIDENAMIPISPNGCVPYYLTAGGVALLAAVFLVFLNTRGNTKVYAMTGGEFHLVHRQRISANAPIIDLTSPEISGGSEEFMIAMDFLIAKKMRGKLIKVVGKNGIIKAQRVSGARRFHIKPIREAIRERKTTE